MWVESSPARRPLDLDDLHAAWVGEIEVLSEQKLLACYQCGRCSAGCPMVDEMDLLPNQVMRLAQLGVQSVLSSQAVWVCASCLTCHARCPKGIDLPRVMEAIRILAMRASGAHLLAGELSVQVLTEAPPMAVIGALRKAGG
jgi:heterodisulfide reductase subunit C2